MYPLPYLRARDLRGGCVLHEVVDSGGSSSAKPRRDVLDSDAHVRAQARVGDRAAGDAHVEELRRGHLDLRPLAVELVRTRPQRAIELAHRGLDEVRVRDPGSVETVG